MKLIDIRYCQMSHLLRTNILSHEPKRRQFVIKQNKTTKKNLKLQIVLLEFK